MKKFLAIIIIILILNVCSSSKILENDETTEVYQVSSVADIGIDRKHIIYDWISRGNTPSVEDIEIEKKDIVYNWISRGNTPDEFWGVIYENPIDAAYKERLENWDGSITSGIRISTTYRDWWRTELNIAYESVMSLLDEEDKILLVNSQNAWEDYMLYSDELNKEFFYLHKYGVFGRIRREILNAEEAEQVRDRAYILLEYLYIFTGEVKLVFNE